MRPQKLGFGLVIMMVAVGCASQSTIQSSPSAADFAASTRVTTSEPLWTPPPQPVTTNTPSPPSLEFEQLDPDMTTSDELLIWYLSNNHIFKALFSPDSRRLSVLTSVGVVIVDADTMKSVLRMKDIQDDTTAIAWSPDGHRLAGGAKSGSVRLWDPSTGDVSAVLEDGAKTVYSIAWSPDGKSLAAASGDGKTRVWDVAQRAVRAVIVNPPSLFVDLAWSPDGRWLASEYGNGHARVLDVSTWKEVVDFLPPSQHAISGFTIAWAADSSWVASGAQDGAVMLWKPATQETALIDDYDADVTGIASSPDSRYLATGDLNSVVEIWDVATGDRVNTLPFSGLKPGVSSISWSPDGKYIVAATYGGFLVRWNVTDEIR